MWEDSNIQVKTDAIKDNENLIGPGGIWTRALEVEGTLRNHYNHLIDLLV